MIIRVSTEFTKSSGTTAYSANDVVGPSGASALIAVPTPYNRVALVGAQIESSGTHDASGYILFVVTSSAFAPGADNAALTKPSYTDGYVGQVILTAANNPESLEGHPFVIVGGSFALPITLPVTVSGNTIYAALQSQAGFTPSSSQPFRLTLFIDVPDPFYR